MNMWRFGECIQIVAETKQKGYSALKERYYEIYQHWNGEKPKAAEWKETKSDIEVFEMVLNKVFDPWG
mgnify:CR=1 FL=1